MNIFKDLKEVMNKCLNGDQGNTKTQLNEIIKTDQGMKAEFIKETELLKKTLAEIRLEITSGFKKKNLRNNPY